MKMRPSATVSVAVRSPNGGAASWYDLRSDLRVIGSDASAARELIACASTPAKSAAPRAESFARVISTERRRINACSRTSGGRVSRESR